MKSLKRVFEDNKLLSNISWQLISQVINMFAGVVSSIIVTRHLGKYYYGIYSYGHAYAAISFSVATIGLENILVSRLSGTDKLDTDEYFGTSFLIKFIADIIVFIFFLIGYFVFFRSEQTNYAVVIFIIPVLFQCIECFRYLYIARYKVKEYLVFQNISVFVGLILRIVGVIFDLGVNYFVVIFAIQSILGHAAAFIAYLLNHYNDVSLRISKNKAYEILMTCAPLALASVALTIYNRVDQLMVTEICGYEDNGVYSVAVTLCEYWYFIPNLITVTLLPNLTRAHRDSLNHYSDMLQKILDILVGISYVMIFLVLLGGKYVVNIVYGNEYQDAATIMTLYIISGVFVSLGYGRGLTCTISGKTALTMWCTLLGTIVNVILNCMLIPYSRAYGAAIATIVAQLFCGYLGTFLNKDFWYIGAMQTKAMFPFVRLARYVRTR